MKRAIRILALLLCCCAALGPYCHAQSGGETQRCPLDVSALRTEQTQGIFVSGLSEEGRLCLSGRRICPGDVLPVSCLEDLVWTWDSEEEPDLTLDYYPIVNGALGERAEMTMHLQPEKDEAPQALDGELETYRNIPNAGQLHCTNDDEGKLIFQIVNHPRRGAVEILPDGAFVYTPKKNKAGEDSFTFTVSDEAGNVSNEATVRIRILQPLDSQTFADLDRQNQFEALWMRTMGLFGGENLADRLCFCPEKTVSRGEFLVMAMNLGGIEPDLVMPQNCFADQNEAPGWMQPYLVTALRRGIVHGIVRDGELCFCPNRAVSGYEAAVMLTGALDLRPESESVSAFRREDDAVPAWAEWAVGLLPAEISRTLDRTALDRARTAALLYRAAAQGD